MIITCKRIKDILNRDQNTIDLKSIWQNPCLKCGWTFTTVKLVFVFPLSKAILITKTKINLNSLLCVNSNGEMKRQRARLYRYRRMLWKDSGKLIKQGTGSAEVVSLVGLMHNHNPHCSTKSFNITVISFSFHPLTIKR